MDRSWTNTFFQKDRIRYKFFCHPLIIKKIILSTISLTEKNILVEPSKSKWDILRTLRLKNYLWCSSCSCVYFINQVRFSKPCWNKNANKKSRKVDTGTKYEKGNHLERQETMILNHNSHSVQIKDHRKHCNTSQQARAIEYYSYSCPGKRLVNLPIYMCLETNEQRARTYIPAWRQIFLSSFGGVH